MVVKAGPLGWRRVALMAAAGIVGLVLGMHGWANRHAGLAGASARGLTAGSSAASPASGHPAPTGPGKAVSPSPGGVGPLLSSEPYAAYAYQVWPGTPGANAERAMTGLTVSVSPQQGGILVRAGVKGQSPGAHTYRDGARVYVVETAVGDDSGNSDYNLGDDGLVVTNAQGRIVQ